MIVAVGEILVDVFDTYQRIGGAPFNFAFHLKQLFSSVRFISRIGNDRWGDEITDLLKRHQFDMADVPIDTIHPTGTVRVALNDQGVPAFDIRSDVAYDYIDFEKVHAIHGPQTRMIYYGTLAQRTDRAFKRFDQLLANKEKNTKSFCDINLRPPHVRWDVLESALRHADILKLNSEELDRIGGFLRMAEKEADLVNHLMGRYDIEMVVLTRGESGSTIFKEGTHFNAPLTDAGRIVDTVGAGDAFAAVIAAGYLRDMPLPKLLAAATRFAADICTLPGAIPEDLSLYDPLRHTLKGATHA